MGKLGFYLLGHFVAYYGLMMAAGILVNIPIAYIQIRQFRLSADDFIIICGFSGLSGIIGAKFLYLVVSFRQINFSELTELSYISSLMNGGFVFLGGIIGVLLAVVFCGKKLHISVQPYIQSCMGCLAIGHTFGRIGCFLVGCCYGVPYTGWFSVTYTDSPFAPCGIGLFPVQLVEAGIEFILGALLLAFSKKLIRYSALFLYLTVYSLSRFFLEFLRYDEVRGQVMCISTSQFLCIFLAAFSSFFLFKGKREQL